MSTFVGSEDENLGGSTWQEYPTFPRSRAPITIFITEEGRCMASRLAMAAIDLVAVINEFMCGEGDSSLSKVTPKTSSRSVGWTRHFPTLIGALLMRTR